MKSERDPLEGAFKGYERLQFRGALVPQVNELANVATSGLRSGAGLAYEQVTRFKKSFINKLTIHAKAHSH